MATLENVNTTDIAAAIRLGCRTMQSVFNADDRGVPFFGSAVRPHAELKFSPFHSEAHVPGRHLNALLSAEDAVGVVPDEAAVEKHRRAAFLSYSGPAPLPLNRRAIGEKPVSFSPHNLREGLHALYALTRYRDDSRARETAERCIAAVRELWTPEHGWDDRRLRALGVDFHECHGFLHGEARMLGPLVKYYRATSYGPALELAIILADKALDEFFHADGNFDRARFITGHVHSITCVLSSLAQLADLLDDASLLTRVQAFYDNGLWAMRDRIGWSPESLGPPVRGGNPDGAETHRETAGADGEGRRPIHSDHGEANNTGDILETALILGRHGRPECYHDAERILRCHLLPSQLRDVSFVIDPANPDGRDGLRNVAGRHLGAFGFPAPYGHQSVGKGRGGLSFNMDIVGGVVGSLCKAYREVVRESLTGRWVNLLFDHETDTLRVRSPYTHDCLEVRSKQPGPLFVRVPPWLAPGGIGPGIAAAGYRFWAHVPAGRTIRLQFPLKEQYLTLSDRVHLRPIRVRLRGDAVAAMDNFGAELTYFPPYVEHEEDGEHGGVYG